MSDSDVLLTLSKAVHLLTLSKRKCFGKSKVGLSPSSSNRLPNYRELLMVGSILPRRSRPLSHSYKTE
jgi:hypothetical protein